MLRTPSTALPMFPLLGDRGSRLDLCGEGRTKKRSVTGQAEHFTLLTMILPVQRTLLRILTMSTYGQVERKPCILRGTSEPKGR